MEITHLYHSGFAVEMKTCILLFDWYQGELPKLPANKPVYVLVSHLHHDHYDPKIWDLRGLFSRVTYIIDDTVPLPAHILAELKETDEPEEISGSEENSFQTKGKRKQQEDESLKCGYAAALNIRMVSPNHRYEAGDLKIETLQSTDEGSAFYILAENQRIYFAGDLNIWWWPERDRSLNLASEKAARMEYEKLKGKQVDLAFLLFDPRLGAEGDRGAAVFMEYADPGHIFPMHYADQQKKAMEYLNDPRIMPYRDRIHFEKQIRI
jgi:L-ascorbate metabolism protein UlaG (beta-lactamase superfamily)